jgi:hypothetical protein
MLKTVLSVFTLLAFLAAVAVFAAPETVTQKADNDKAQFQQKANAKFNEYDMKFRDWSKKAKAQTEKEYKVQKAELELHRKEAAKDIRRLGVRSKEYTEESWRMLKEETNRSLDEFGKALERAGEKLRK